MVRYWPGCGMFGGASSGVTNDTPARALIREAGDINLTCEAAYVAVDLAFSDGTLTLKVDDKEKEFKIPSDLKIKRKGKDGTETEISASDALSKAKEGREITLTVDDGKVTNVKMARKGK